MTRTRRQAASRTPTRAPKCPTTAAAAEADRGRLDFPRSFIDEQVKGPFKAFRHVHEFAATPSGSTMVDRVEFTAPLGVLGRAVERMFLARYLERLIAQRGGFLAGADRRIN
ncbi:hypothetical protein FBY33_4056 [Arthrobacter sp. SLBN-112]|nr:hypothetical protein FBY33_4056 [Arthrobacter sp. SLBN-112]